MYYGGTSNLRTHLKNVHPSVWPTTKSGDEEDKTPAGTKSIEFFYTTDNKSRRVCSNAKSEAISNLVVNVNFDGQKCHASGKKKLCNVLQKEVHFVAVTTDAWTSKAVKLYFPHVLHISLMTTGTYRVMY